MGEGEARDMARAFTEQQKDAGGRGLLAAVGAGEEESRHQRLSSRVAGGFAALASGSGPLADALRRAGASDTSKFDVGRVRAELQGLSREDLARLAPGQREQVERIMRGGREGDAALAAFGSQYGERAERLRREYQEKRGFGARMIDRLFGGGEDQYVNQNLQRSTEADRRADEQQGQVSAAEALAQRMGIGRAGDPMNEAASELRRAAEALQSVVQGGSLDRAVAGE
jgi:hypothetical protein